jgi:hypothetical protein
MVLALVHYISGELYSAFEWDVNNESVRLEVHNGMGDVKRIAKLLELKVMSRTHPYDTRTSRAYYLVGINNCTMVTLSYG